MPSLRYQAASWAKPRRVVGKVEWHLGELFPRVGFIITNTARRSRNGNFLRTLATPEAIAEWSLTSLREKLIKIGAKVVIHERYVTFQMAGVALPWKLFAAIMQKIAALRSPPITATHELPRGYPRGKTSGRPL
jgi:hypothetical protein